MDVTITSISDDVKIYVFRAIVEVEMEVEVKVDFEGGSVGGSGRWKWRGSPRASAKGDTRRELQIFP